MKFKVSQPSSGLIALAPLVLTIGWLVAGASALAQDQQRPDPAQIARGSVAWSNHCQRCHNLRSPSELNDAEWNVAVTHMRVRANIPGQQARDITAFLKSSNIDSFQLTQPAVAEDRRLHVATATDGVELGASALADTVKGKQLYNGTCIACHGANGKGVVPGTPDLTKSSGRLEKSDEALLKSMTEGLQSEGSPMPMPPKGGNPALTRQDLVNVLAYLREAFGE